MGDLPVQYLHGNSIWAIKLITAKIRSLEMGDKGKKDKGKSEKQKTAKQQQKDKTKKEKQQKK